MKKTELLCQFGRLMGHDDVEQNLAQFPWDLAPPTNQQLA